MAVRRRKKEYRASVFRDGFFVVRHLRAFLEDALGAHVRSGSRVGDVGCGEQPLRNLIEHLGGTYTGIDIQQNSSGTVDVIAPAARIPLDDHAFDVVVCTEVLEHTPDPLQAFLELARLLSPGGHLVLTTPFTYGLHEEPHDYSRVTQHWLRKQAKDCDLEVVEIRAMGNEIEALATVWDAAWRGIAPARLGLLPGAWVALMRCSANILALVGSALFGRWLPCKHYLSNVAVLRHRPG